MADGDLIARSLVDGNFLDRIRTLELQMQELLRKPVQVGQLTDISENIGSGQVDTAGLIMDGDGQGPKSIGWFINDDQYQVGRIWAYGSGVAPDYVAEADFYAQSFGTSNAVLNLFAVRNADNKQSMLRLDSDIATVSDGGAISYIDPSGQTGAIFRGGVASYALYNSSIAANTILNKTIKANAIGANGVLGTHVMIRLINGASGAARNITIDASLGGTTLFSFAGTATTVQNRSSIFDFWMAIANQNSASAQVASAVAIHAESLTPGTALAAATGTRVGTNTATVATTSDQPLLITGTMSAANAALSFEVIAADVFGPYYAV